MEQVILVDDDDCQIGVQEKLEAHTRPLLHRAVSVFTFNADGHLLLQRRADSKYHSPGLWSNTCCGHPRPNESTVDAAQRRLSDEMGLTCPLQPIGVARYELTLEGGLFEHEITHIFVGSFDAAPALNPQEASDWKWADSQTLNVLRREKPGVLTPWFEHVLAGLVRGSEARQTALPPSVAATIRAWG